MSWYCELAPGHPVHGPYHDSEYGFPATDETVLFERLSLEIFQAGLSWLLVLKKREALNRAFAGFSVDRVAAFGEDDAARLLADAAIIRNRAKVRAVIANANRIRGLRERSGSFAGWLAAHHPLDEAEWLRLFGKTFSFAGPEVVREFLMSIGYLPGAHSPECPVYGRIAATGPAWMGGEGGASPRP
jgi:DNA-3-methyladenine glycosylase I